MDRRPTGLPHDDGDECPRCAKGVLKRDGSGRLYCKTCRKRPEEDR